MKYLALSLAVLAAGATMSAPASAITCPAGTHLVMSKGANPHLVCMGTSTMSAKRKMTAPKPVATKKPS
jgi:hypothetical protein